MRAVCDTCGARYRIPEEKLEGKVLRIRCRKCENVFTVQDTREASAAEAPAPVGEWFFAISGESFGPYTQEALLERFESGRLGADTFIWKQGFSEWMPVSEHPTFAAGIELSKDSLRRFSDQRPDSRQNTEGSGRFTVELRRPGATLGSEYRAKSSVIEDEVNDAFDSLIGSVQSHRRDIDQDTATEPMRNLGAAGSPEAELHEEPKSQSPTTITSTKHADTPSVAARKQEAAQAAAIAAQAAEAERAEEAARIAVEAAEQAAADAEEAAREAQEVADHAEAEIAAQIAEEAAARAAAEEAARAVREAAAEQAAAEAEAKAAAQAAAQAAADAEAQRAAQVAEEAALQAQAEAAAQAAAHATAEAERAAREAQEAAAQAQAEEAKQAAEKAAAAAVATAAKAPPGLPARRSSGLPTPATSGSAAGAGLSLAERLAQIRERSAASTTGGDKLPSPARDGLPPPRPSAAKPALPTKPARPVSAALPAVEATTLETSLRAEEATPPAGHEAVVPAEIASTLLPVDDYRADDSVAADGAANDAEIARRVRDNLDSELEETLEIAIRPREDVDSLSSLFSDDEADELFGDGNFLSAPERSAADERSDADEDSDTDAILAALQPSKVVNNLSSDDVASQRLAPLPKGPIRQVTQDIDVGDLFDDTEDTDPSGVAVGPTDAELQQFLDKRTKERSGAFAVAASASSAAQATPVGGTAAVPMPKSEAGTVRAAPTTGKSTAVPIEEVESLQKERAKQRKMMKVLVGLLASLLIGVLVLMLLPKRAPTEVAVAPEVEVVPDAPAVDLAAVERARNRAASIVAQSLARAASAAFVATEDDRNQKFAANSRGQRSGNGGSSRSAAAPADMGFHLQASARPNAPAVRREQSSGPSSSHFAGTLQGAVRSSVGRCAQRARAMDGGLSASRLELSITIRPDGTVDKISAQRDVRDSTLMNCLRNESMRWRFASFDGSNATITHPFVIQ